MDLIDKSFLKAPKRYIIQCLLATACAALILYFIEIISHAAIVAALGASTFIVFAMPQSIIAQPRRLIGGQIVGLICGTICYFVFLTGSLGELGKHWEYISWIASALAIGLSIFLMAITNTEHPPAASTAVGLVIHGWSYQSILFVLLYVLGLALIRWLLRDYLKNLF